MNPDPPPDLLRIDGLKKSFAISSGLFSRPFKLTALEDISFSVKTGETKSASPTSVTL